jgi:hypothetical protein
MERIEVTARFDKNGKVIPLFLVWKGHRYTIDNLGRQWQAADGLHALVMTPTGRMFELLFVTSESQWYLIKVHPDLMVA